MESKKTYGSVSESGVIQTLLKPSNNSTSNPSLENLATADGTAGTDVQGDETSHLIQNPEVRNEVHTESCHQPLKATSFEEALRRHVTGRDVRKRTIAIFVALSALLIGITFWFFNFSSLNVDPSTWRDGDLLPYGPSKKKNVTRSPFSRLHPVSDMWLYDFPRPKTSRPARPIKEGLLNRKTYPTNAWYQSLLAPEDEPSELHRSYAVPYVVDTIGPMPGLRLHPNHIDASTYVITLYVIDEYGLTFGAAVNAASSKHHRKIESPTHKYKVTHATPLGVTLDWVSYSERLQLKIYLLLVQLTK
jgi:hypothetical protein